MCPGYRRPLNSRCSPPRKVSSGVSRAIFRIDMYNASLNAIVPMTRRPTRRQAVDAAQPRRRARCMGCRSPSRTAMRRPACARPPVAATLPICTHAGRRGGRPVRAGAVIMGKTNMPAATRTSGSNPAFGRNNHGTPRARQQLGRRQGGRHRDRADQLRLRLEVGGTTRIPAHYCGLYGHRRPGARFLWWAHSQRTR